MPPRYQQGGLPSPVTGTPGIDQSAGAVEREIAQTADRLGAIQTGQAMNTLRNAEGFFYQAQRSFNQIASEMAARQRQAAAIKQAEEVEKRKEQVQWDLMDEDKRLDGILSDLKTQYADNPYGALDAWKQQAPQVQDDFLKRYANDPIKQRMVMPFYRQGINRLDQSVAAWAESTDKSIREARKAALPLETLADIAELRGTTDDQMRGFMGKLSHVAGLYDTWIQQAEARRLPAEVIKLKSEKQQLAFDASKAFVQHLEGQTPEGEAGLSYLSQLKEVIKSPETSGIALTDNDRLQAINKIESYRSARVQDLVEDQRGNNAIELMDIGKFKWTLENSAKDPAAMANAAAKIQETYQQLESRIAQAEKEPPSEMRLEKLRGLKDQQKALISSFGLEQRMMNSFEATQRAVAKAIESSARSAERMAMSQAKFQAWQSDQATKAKKEELANQKAAATGIFNRDWAGIQNQYAAAFALPPGKEQQAEILKIANKAQPILDAAVAKGIINGDTYGKYLSQGQRHIEDAMKIKESQPWIKIGSFSFGGGAVTPLKGTEKMKAAIEAQKQAAEIVKSKQEHFAAMNEAINQVSINSTSKPEREFLSSFINANLPSLLNSAGYKSLSPAEQAKRRAKAVNAAIMQYRQGKLK